jgi:lipopolysaccharide biosynthesis regulator YciM
MRGFESRIRRIEGAAKCAAQENRKLSEIIERLIRAYKRMGKAIDPNEILTEAQFWLSPPKILAEILTAAIEWARRGVAAE